MPGQNTTIDYSPIALMDRDWPEDNIWNSSALRPMYLGMDVAARRARNGAIRQTLGERERLPAGQDARAERENAMASDPQ
jgi:hypothetical protein